MTIGHMFLFAWAWFWRMPLVILEDGDGELTLARTFTLDGQLLARRFLANVANVVCLPDGTTRGRNYVKRWRPANSFAQQWTTHPLPTPKEIDDVYRVGWKR